MLLLDFIHFFFGLVLDLIHFQNVSLFFFFKSSFHADDPSQCKMGFNPGNQDPIGTEQMT